MNKIENLAYLFATMMDSDGKVNVKELNTWYQIIKSGGQKFLKKEQEML